MNGIWGIEILRRTIAGERGRETELARAWQGGWGDDSRTFSWAGSKKKKL